jgi:hypothetical protein
MDEVVPDLFLAQRAKKFGKSNLEVEGDVSGKPATLVISSRALMSHTVLSRASGCF